jgi:hypothetical protein
MTVTLRTMTSSVDGVDVGWAVFSGFIALHLRKRVGADWFNADLGAFGQHQGVRVVPR